MVTFIDTFFLGIALTLPLGPITLEILRRGIKYNFSQGLRTASGAFTAELTYFCLVYFGLASFMESNFIQMGLGGLGVGFLLYFGYLNLNDFIEENGISERKKSSKNAFTYGYVITFFNPLNFFMWVGIIGGFFAQNTSLFVSSGVLLGIFLSLFSIAVIGGVARKKLTHDKLKFVSLFAGIFLIYYGARLFANFFPVFSYWQTILIIGIIFEIYFGIKIVKKLFN